MKHAGAAVKGPFSRWNITEALYQDRKMFSTPHIYSLAAYLHPLAEHVSFKDDLGNIMGASQKTQAGLLRVSFSPRYPLLGGWQTRFVLGYTLPLQAAVTTGARGKKEVTFGQSPIFEEVRSLVPSRIRSGCSECEANCMLGLGTCIFCMQVPGRQSQALGGASVSCGMEWTVLWPSQSHALLWTCHDAEEH